MKAELEALSRSLRRHHSLFITQGFHGIVGKEDVGNARHDLPQTVLRRDALWHIVGFQRAKLRHAVPLGFDGGDELLQGEKGLQIRRATLVLLLHLCEGNPAGGEGQSKGQKKEQ